MRHICRPLIPGWRYLVGVVILIAPPLFGFPLPKIDPNDRPSAGIMKQAVNEDPFVEIAVHTIGNVQLMVANIGQFGTGYLGSLVDPVTQMAAPSCIFPAGSNINYLYVGSFWIGAVMGRDTLVSIGVDDYYSVVELWPDPAPRGGIERRSIQAASPYFDEKAVSEQDILAVYTDTVTSPGLVISDPTDGRPHIPLGIEITQRSYSWSYDYAQDFILFDYGIKNIGRRNLEKVYMGIYVDGDVHHTSRFGNEGYGEDLCGFKRSYPAGIGCDYEDTINIAYIMDNDGDPSETATWSNTSARGAAGVHVVRTPSDSLSYSFNWWVTNYDVAGDFGPRRAGTDEDPFRDMNGVLGTPNGDRNKYYVMRHSEFDYDQMYTGKDHTSDGWLPRPEGAADFADGFDARYLLSFGPFDIKPGEILPVTFAFVCGDFLHTEADNFRDLFNISQPEIFYNTLDFSNLATNSKWASWVYDNPNYDTDGDGYRGKFRICCLDSIIEIDTMVTPPETSFTCLRADTSYYKGDGVPDFRGAAPPSPPKLRIAPRINERNEGELRVRWNGLKSEMERDVFSNRRDFEGYRLYTSLTPKVTDFTLIKSYDQEDYNRWVWNPVRRRWILPDPPLTLDSLRALYGVGFEPLQYSIDNHYYRPNPGGQDSAFYFTRQDWNFSDLSDTMLIHKGYPEQPFPSTLDADSARIYFPEELTDEGYFKYFEYEYVLRNLLPSQLYYVSVTAFDYGSPGHGLVALESKTTANMVGEYPQNSSALVEEGNLQVVVYPNPYRIDGNYRSLSGGGFEGRGQEDLSADRVRAIHFANLPHRCTIRIFTVDGDLVREIKHDLPAGAPQSMHEKWDLITRNTQSVSSGIYYYSVESEFGNQIGKLVIIL